MATIWGLEGGTGAPYRRGSSSKAVVIRRSRRGSVAESEQHDCTFTRPVTAPTTMNTRKAITTPPRINSTRRQ